MYVMSDMELDDEQQFDMPGCMGDGARQKYPYGLRISLTEKEMAKLRIDPAEAFVGGVCHLHAMAKITSVSCNETESLDGSSSDSCRIELQITSMCIESEDEENEEVEDANAGMKKHPLYDGA